ncbi:MAG: pyrroloquinoline quinone biosynthesis peptide chaperone PqqD [Alphaproteobacteria bacterium]|nr:pyrroloquinoline quinone biosynthesis peptide chaperone PqqD [Alphaproteobacteria bacterium]
MHSEGQLEPSDVMELNPNFHFRWEEPQQSHVLLYPEGIVKLNATAAEILEMCVMRGLTVAEGTEQLAHRYDGADLVSDVMQFMELAYAKGWIRPKS